MSQIPMSMEALAAAIREGAELDAQHLYGRQVVFTLPSSGDTVVLWPAGRTRPQSLCWRHASPADVTIESGFLDWDSTPQRIVTWAIDRAYSLSQITPQYAPVLTALRGRGLNAHIVDADGGGFLIRVDLPDSTYLLIGGDESLPDRADQVEQWRVQHEGVNGHIAVVYYGRGAEEMANASARYVSGTMTRYGGWHPLGGMAPGNKPDGPDKLYGLISDLSAIRHSNRTAPGGSLITVADADGSNGASIDVPAEVVTRISRLLAAELAVIEAYGG